MKYIIYLCLFGFMVYQAQAQTTVSGQVRDAQTGESLIGVNITIKDKFVGTISNTEGNFILNTQTSPPFTLIVSLIGYASQEINISQSQQSIDVQLQEQAILGEEIVVRGSRFEEDLLESSISVEKIDILTIRESPATNFYESLRNVKGVDMVTQSLTFSNPNTRGFNGNTNYRVNQIIDGVDNVAPGLNFAAGNIVGSSQLDIESVELLVGASSALYGPGGMNGTILMTTKNPFDYQGLSIEAQNGFMHFGADYRDSPTTMQDIALRYAKAFNDKFAFKINASYLRALDWHATDYRDQNDLSNPNLNPYNSTGYDGVNTYGDENVGVNINRSGSVASRAATGYANTIADDSGFAEGSPEYEAAFDEAFAFALNAFPTENMFITRTGYREEDLADYDTESLKLSTSLYYRINENLEWNIQGFYGRGTSVYTASNRFSLIDFSLFSGKTELKGKNFFVRAYGVWENGGSSYDIGGLAAQLNENWKPSEDWYTDYLGSFLLNRLSLGNSIAQTSKAARESADNRTAQGTILDPSKPFRPLPGEPAFEQLSKELKNTLVKDGGAGIIDRTRMYHFEGMYDFSEMFKFAEVLAGASYRLIVVDSEGTIFGDEDEPHRIGQIGAYLQVAKQIFDNKINVTGSARYDKNDNFEGRVTPRVSLVYTVDKARQHNFRASVQTAFRFPSIADQYTNLDVGAFRVIGGLPQFRTPYNFAENPIYTLDNPNPLLGSFDANNQEPFQFPEFRPERVVAYEVGYKGLFIDKLLIDAYAYFNTYDGFVANQAFAQPIVGEDTRFFLSAVSTETPVNAYGWALGFDYQLPKGYFLSANVAYNALESADGNFPDGFLTSFNSPDYRTNVSFSNREVVQNLGFSVQWRWQNAFTWESTFGVGDIPAFSTLDAQVSYKVKKLKSIVKVGASNLLNHYYTTGFGNPQIGGLYYIKITFDEFLN